MNKKPVILTAVVVLVSAAVLLALFIMQPKPSVTTVGGNIQAQHVRQNLGTDAQQLNECMRTCMQSGGKPPQCASQCGAQLTPKNTTQPPQGNTSLLQGNGTPSITNTSFEASEGPYYFIAIHNEPYHNDRDSDQKLAAAYSILSEMVEQADEYNIKLTLMLTAQWADYIISSPERTAEVRSWEANGHEISGHHHGVYHGSWDGYSGYPEAEALAIRQQKGKHESYIGTLSDYINELQQIDSNVNSGCMNDESDKTELPDEIIYDTCSGFANSGEPGTRAGDGDYVKGKNDFVLTAVYNGIKRHWLTHYAFYQDVEVAKTTFESMSSGVFGGVTHSVAGQDEALYDLMAFLHENDPTGEYSRTLSEVIEEHLLPEEQISEELISQKYTSGSSKPTASGSCGNGICDALEEAHSEICPYDCGS